MTTVRRKIPEGFRIVNCRGYKPADCTSYTVEDELLNRQLSHDDYWWGYVIDHDGKTVALMYWPRELGVVIHTWLILDVSEEEADKAKPFYDHSMVIGKMIRTRAFDRGDRGGHPI